MFYRSRVPCIADGQQGTNEDKTKSCGSVKYTILYDIASLLRTAQIIYNLSRGILWIDTCFGMKEGGPDPLDPPPLNPPLSILVEYFSSMHVELLKLELNKS